MRAFLLALALGAVPAALAADGPPTVAQVRAFMESVADASRARDLVRLTAALADDCRIELHSTVEGREHVTLLTRAEYVELLSSGFAALKDLEHYDYRVSDLEVTLDRDPPGATVTSRVHEAFVLNGRPSATESRETARVERRGPELKLVAVSSETEGR